MPGGRLEPDETPEDALRREVLEETGWSLACFRPIGIMHFRHIDPMPDGYPYPYPDLLHVVYAATPGEYHPELREVDGYELGAEFVSVDEARRLDLDAGQHVFLDAALRVEHQPDSPWVFPAMPIVIITPIAEEYDALTKALDQRWQGHDLRQVGRIQAHVYRSGDVIIAQGGLGKVQFAVTTQHLLDNLDDLSLVVCAGVSGSLTRDASVGDVVIGTTTVEHDFNSKSPDARLPRFDGSARHLAALRKAYSTSQSTFQVHLGPIASGDEAILNASRASELHSRTGALAVAWEGAGGARAAAFSRVPYVEVRGISDMADHDASSTWKANLPDAMRNVAVVVAYLAECLISGP